MTRVPVVPTMEQLIAGRKQITSATGKMSRLMSQRLADVYRAMVATAKGSEMRELLGKTGAEHQASVMYQTFGHLDAKRAKSIKVTSFLSTVSTAICVLCIVNFHPLTKVPLFQ